MGKVKTQIINERDDFYDELEGMNKEEYERLMKEAYPNGDPPTSTPKQEE